MYTVPGYLQERSSYPVAACARPSGAAWNRTHGRYLAVASRRVFLVCSSPATLLLVMADGNDPLIEKKPAPLAARERGGRGGGASWKGSRERVSRAVERETGIR